MRAEKALLDPRGVGDGTRCRVMSMSVGALVAEAHR
jgi:hypothetical protein